MELRLLGIRGSHLEDQVAKETAAQNLKRMLSTDGKEDKKSQKKQKTFDLTADSDEGDDDDNDDGIAVVPSVGKITKKKIDLNFSDSEDDILFVGKT